MNAVTRIGLLLVAILAQSAVWAALPAPPAPPPPKYDNLYVFGDSLSDTGNDIILTKAQRISPAIPPSESPHRTYYKGRFSNGPVAVEYLWQSMRGDSKASVTPVLSTKGPVLKGAINYAFGGSTSEYVNQTPGQFYVPGVLGQVDMFRKALQGKHPPARTLYLVWTGANDYLAVPPAQTAQPTEVIANITKAVETLYSLGARDFMIPNLPDLGHAPIAGANAAGLSQVTLVHNTLLADARDDLVARLQGVKITLPDIYAASQTMLDKNFAASPPALAMVSPPAPGAVDCLFRDPTTCPDVNLNIPIESGSTEFYFWDILHPTTAAHRELGKAMFESLSKGKAP